VFPISILKGITKIKDIMSASATTQQQTKRSPRLHVDGAILGYQRGLRNQKNIVSLIKIKGADDKKAAEFYIGKRVAFITKAANGTFRVNWGKVCRHHGSNGVVRCRFSRNLPPQAIGGRVRVMLYPSRV
jgi:large subunit ribosomal protein L35Ae